MTSADKEYTLPHGHSADTPTMRQDAEAKFDDRFVRGLGPPEKGNRISYDRGSGSVKGFGIRVTAAGAKSFIVTYRIAGQERRMTIGAYPDWSVSAARLEAARIKREADLGHDPLAERHSAREAPTVSELCDRYLAEHAVRKRTGEDDRSMVERIIRPRIGSRKAVAVAYADIDALHRKVTENNGRYAANRVLALLSKMFSLAIRWQIRPDNPAKGVERNPEERRYRYLSSDELRRLSDALTAYPNQVAANAIRLLVLTGARRGEVLAATWDQFDLDAGIWTKPSSHTKQKREHRVPLSAAARQLLTDMRAKAQRDEKLSYYLFPGRLGDGPMVEIKTCWAALCRAAKIDSIRIHDLRHTYASILASAGQSLPVIGALLGHTQPGTTARYAHLFDDPLRAATDRVGDIFGGSVPYDGAPGSGP